MREILFRGKTKGGKWVYGFYLQSIGEVDVIRTKTRTGGRIIWEEFEVIPETVGQYTGLQDKSGKKIFEGDVVYSEGSQGPVKYYMDQEGCQFAFEDHKGEGYDLSSWATIEIIGNIHDK